MRILAVRTPWASIASDQDPALDEGEGRDPG